MAGGGPGGGVSPSVAQAGFFARLKTDLSGVSNTLTLLPYKGNTVLVNAKTVTIPALGLTRLVTDNLITALGADSGGPPAASTLYYVYVANSLASFSPSSIRLSATAPSLVGGVKYLGVAGNALNWRFVGWVMPNATPNFESSTIKRFIANYYNREALTLFCNPGYVNSNAFGTTLLPQASWALINGGVGDGFKWIGNGEDSSMIRASCMQDGASFAYVGISLNGGDPANAGSQANLNTTVTADQQVEPLEGLNTADMWGFGAGGSLFYHDVPRGGLAAGPSVTYMTALIQG
jgi:hypothetical protein